MRISDWSSDVCSSDLFGIARRPVGAPLGPRPFDFGEAAVDETRAEAIESLLDAPDVREVAADPDDHAADPVSDPGPGADATASSMDARMRRIAASRPTKIASPTRK